MSKSRNIISALLITVMIASVFCIPVLTNNEVDAAAKKVKIKWNANGGKFTAKKYAKKKSYTKKLKKTKKVGTLPKVKRLGYTFKGWYTKKSGGKKITSKTKIKKKATYYAQWKKRVLSTEEKSLVGLWGAKIKSKKNDKDNDIWEVWKFNSNGTYGRTMTTVWFAPIKSTITVEDGVFTAKAGVISCTSIVGHVETYGVGSEWYASWQNGKAVKPTKTTKAVSSTNKNWYYQIKPSLSDGLPVITIADTKTKMESTPPLWKYGSGGSPIPDELKRSGVIPK